MSLIRAENISFVYSTGTSFEKKALDNVSFEIEKGEFVGIIGHTGSGKSTLIQLLNGLLKPTEGNIFFDEKNIWDEPKKIRNIRFRVGMVFQYPEYQLFEETVYKDIAFGPHNMGLDDDETELLQLWERILSEARKTAGYNKKLTYGVYQIWKELNTFREEGTGNSKKIYDYPVLNGYLIALRNSLKAYYKSHITEKLFRYELLK